MIPDFPETKRLFTRFFRTYMRQKMRQISPYGAVQTRHLHEGRAMHIMRADQSESTSDIQLLSTEIQINFDEIKDLTLQKVLQKHDAMLFDLVSKQTNLMRERMDAEIPASQTVDAKGKKLDANLVLEVLDKMQIEFYPDGTPHQIYVDGSQFTAETMAAIDKQFEDSPELQQKYNDLIERKKEEWRAREADRKLVG